MNWLKAFCLCAAASVLVVSCGGRGASSADSDGGSRDSVDDAVNVPSFDEDSAFAYVKRQVEFGPRVPGSAAHRTAAEWMVSKLRSFDADTVIEQVASMPKYDGSMMPVRNIFARFNSDKPKHLLLLAHYDTRPWADEDPDPANHKTPIDGANDGASGVGVILEIVRHVSQSSPAIGIDVLFTDSEDSGISHDDDASVNTDDTWCIGTQYFVQNLPYKPSQLPYGAILLDMVGGKNAVFNHEYFSEQNAPGLLNDVWSAARQAGYGSRFSDSMAGAINDDHVHLPVAGIPAIDIIEIGHPETGTFNPTWHTLKDNIDNIDPATLKAVGQTVIQYIYTR